MMVGEKSKVLAVFSVVILLTTSCATREAKTSDNVSEENDGMLEAYNHGMFKFNYQFDKYVMKPLAKGYRYISNEYVRERVSNVIANMHEPISGGNHLLQGSVEDAGVSLARFTVNLTLGLGGMYDVAGGWGLKKDSTGFDETFAKWCIPDGPYVVIPFMGPGTPRSFTGMALNFVFDPVFWTTYQDANIKDKVSYSYAAVQFIAAREAALDLTDDLERNSVDYYTTMKSTFMQNRQNKGCLNDTDKTTYDFDFGYEEEDQIFDDMEKNN